MASPGVTRLAFLGPRGTNTEMAARLYVAMGHDPEARLVAAESITAVNDNRIRSPATFNMSWDTLDVTATIGGATSRVSGTVSKEDAGKTLVVDVTTDFAAGDQITISDLSFRDFTASSSADNLELEVNNDGAVSATDDKTITITSPPATLSSAANQTFSVGALSTANSTLPVPTPELTPTIKNNPPRTPARVRRRR